MRPEVGHFPISILWHQLFLTVIAPEIRKFPCNRVDLVISSLITLKSDLIAIFKNIVIAVLAMNTIKSVVASSLSPALFRVLLLALQSPMHSSEPNRTTNSELLWTVSAKGQLLMIYCVVDNEIRRQPNDWLVLSGIFCSGGISGRILWITFIVN